MAEDVTGFATPGPGRRADPLSAGEQARLRQLRGRKGRTAEEAFEAGALTAKARNTQQGRRFLDDLAHQRLADGRQGGVTARQVGEALGAAIVAGVERALDDLDDDRDRW